VHFLACGKFQLLRIIPLGGSKNRKGKFSRKTNGNLVRFEIVRSTVSSYFASLTAIAFLLVSGRLAYRTSTSFNVLIIESAIRFTKRKSCSSSVGRTFDYTHKVQPDGENYPVSGMSFTVIWGVE